MARRILLAFAVFVAAWAGCSDAPTRPQALAEDPQGRLVVQVLTDEFLPVGGAQVSVKDSAWVERTRDDGRTESVALAPGAYVVVAEAAGYSANSTRVDVTANETTNATIVLVRPAVPEPAWTERDGQAYCHVGRRGDDGAPECWNPVPFSTGPRMAWTASANVTDLLLVWFEWEEAAPETRTMSFDLLVTADGCADEEFAEMRTGDPPVTFRFDASTLSDLGFDACDLVVSATVSASEAGDMAVVLDQTVGGFLLARHPGQGETT